MTDVVLGLDLGTTGAKVGVLTLGADGRAAPDAVTQPVAHAAVPWTTTPTGAEIDPDLLADVALAALEQACQARPDARVRAVGLASFAESVVLLDARGRPLAPLVAWHDTRGGPEAADLARRVGADAFSSRTGLPVSALASACKVRALASAGLDLSRVVTVLSAADWLAHRLTGTSRFDLSLASRTGWLDLASKDWAEDLLAWTGLALGTLPPVVAAGSARGAAVGAVPPGLLGALVVGAGMDHHVAAVGAGAASAGDVWDSCGTAEAFLRSTAPLPPTSVLDAVRRGLEVGWHADPEHQVVLGAQRSGYAFQRALTLLGVGSTSEMHALEAGGDAPTVDLPVLVGVYGEAYDVTGLTSRSRAEHVWAALVDQVASDGARLLRQIDAVAGPHTRVVTGGGWADSTWFAAAKRRHLPDVAATTLPQPGAHGAALLALAALDDV